MLYIQANCLVNIMANQLRTEIVLESPLSDKLVGWYTTSTVNAMIKWLALCY